MTGRCGPADGRRCDSASGRFLQTDPVPGGSANNYDYCDQDPINCYDLQGTFHFKKFFKKILSNPVFQAVVTVAVCAGTDGIGCAVVNYGFAAYNSFNDCRHASALSCAGNVVVNVGAAKFNYRSMDDYRGQLWKTNRWGSPLLKTDILPGEAYTKALLHNSGVAAVSGAGSWAYHHWLD